MAKNRFLFFTCLVSLLITKCLGQTKNYDDFERKLDEYLTPYLEMEAWSGVVQITNKGETIFSKPYGFANREWDIPNTIDTKFRIASISKLFTEVAILKLVEEGKISLEDTLNQFIPDYPRGDEITIKSLLNHTSGIPHLNSYPNYSELIKFDYSIQEIIDLFKEKELDFNPGEKYSYSNSGYVLLAFIIEHVIGKTYRDYLDGAIWTPLELDHTGIDENKKVLPKRASGYQFDNEGNLVNAEYVNMDIKIGGGSMYSTVSDVTKFVEAVVNKKLVTENLNELPNYGQSNGVSYFSANGRVQGFCHQVTHWIDDNLTITVLGNHYSNIALPISGDIYSIYKGDDYAIPKNYLKTEVDISSEELKKYEGTYDFGFGPIGVVKVVKDRLTYRGPGRKEYDVLAYIGNDTFFYKQNWVLLRFTNKNDEEFRTLEWVMGENAYPAKKQ